MFRDYLGDIIVGAVFLSGMLYACGAEVSQKQQAEARVVVTYPECRGIENVNKRIKCIKAASKIQVQVDGEEVVDIVREVTP